MQVKPGARRINVGPARAGMIRSAMISLLRWLGWPRTSGDDPQFIDILVNRIGLAPHERG